MNTQQQPPSAGGDPDEVLPSLPLALPEETGPEETERYRADGGASPYASPYVPSHAAGPWQGPVDHDEPQAQPLNRPVRWLIAGVEVVLVVGLAFLAAWAWDRATVPVRLPDYENPAIPDFVDRQSGPWTALAVGFGLLAALLLMDAVRQALLAVRLRDRPPPAESATHGDPDGDPADDPADDTRAGAAIDGPVERA